MDCSKPGLPVHHQLPEFTQTHVHWVGDAIQSSHPLLSPSPPTFNLSQHQGLFKWVSSSHQGAKVLCEIIFNILNFTKIGEVKAQRGKVICTGREHQLLQSPDQTPSPTARLSPTVCIVALFSTSIDICQYLSVYLSTEEKSLKPLTLGLSTNTAVFIEVELRSSCHTPLVLSYAPGVPSSIYFWLYKFIYFNFYCVILTSLLAVSSCSRETCIFNFSQSA